MIYFSAKSIYVFAFFFGHRETCSSLIMESCELVWTFIRVYHINTFLSWLANRFNAACELQTGEAVSNFQM